MLVISYGIERSGSTLAFEMARGLLIENGFDQSVLESPLVVPARRINLANRWDNETLQGLVGETEHRKVAVRTHAPPGDISSELVAELAGRGKLKVQATYRDPRDIVLSLIDAGRDARENGRTAFAQIDGIDAAIHHLHRSVKIFIAWSRLQATLFRYDDLAFNMSNTIRRMARDLGLPTIPDFVRGYLAAAFTERNKGIPNRYLAEMSPVDSAKIETEFSDFFDLIKRTAAAGPR
jgi:hypothetical protein